MRETKERTERIHKKEQIEQIEQIKQIKQGREPHGGAHSVQDERADRASRILLIIPAYNEAESIVPVVEELKHDYPQYDYIVVTDGSTDGTDRICRLHGFRTICLPVNLGLAGCFQTGMKYAFTEGYGAAVQFDGDGQHRPEYIAAMKQKLDEGYDIVLGSRLIGEESQGMAPLRGFGSRLIRLAIRCTTGVRVTDPTCGLRMYNRRMIQCFAERINYAPEPDTISFLLKNGAHMAEVPVKVAERTGGLSYLRPFNAVKYMLRMLTSILLIQNFRERAFDRSESVVQTGTRQSASDPSA